MLAPVSCFLLFQYRHLTTTVIHADFLEYLQNYWIAHLENLWTDSTNLFAKTSLSLKKIDRYSYPEKIGQMSGSHQMTLKLNDLGMSSYHTSMEKVFLTQI